MLGALLACAAPGPGSTRFATPSAWGRPDEGRVYPIETAGAPSRGPQEAPVTVVEFADFRCPYCRVATRTLDRIHQAYPREVRTVFKHLPAVSEASGRAAIAAVAAQRQGRFWEMHDVLFELQGQPLSEALLRRHARALGLDVERFSADLRSEQVVAVVEADLAEADRLGIEGTPAFFVNGRYLPGAQSFASLAALIDEQLARAP